MKPYSYLKALINRLPNQLILSLLDILLWRQLTLRIIILLLINSSAFSQNISESRNIEGAENLLNNPSLLKDLAGKRLGLICNQTTVVGNRYLVDLLQEKGLNLVLLFTPEHGFRGTADAGETLESYTDPITGIRVVSLYGKQKGPTPAQMDSIDVLIYDLEDVGCRFYTYISTLEYCLNAAGKASKEFWVLDRLGYNKQFVAGPVLEHRYKTFVGMQPIPILYGMTPGEYALMLKNENWITAPPKFLNVVKGTYYNGLKKKFEVSNIAPSPNLKTNQAIALYPSLCLFEGTPISVGRGTATPFEVLGCPIPTTGFFNFTPKVMIGAKDPLYKDQLCYGIDLSKAKQEGFTLKYLAEMYQKYPDKGRFFKPFLDRLAGTATIKEKLIAGKPYQEIEKSWQTDLAHFKLIRKKYLLYFENER
jgi:uncharacterized protein YbbC (DUF1343 family)